uniref:Uncharacterized protein n=1 Tax=Physcomitrium patens TaxID=3218 RepID=A0A2K1IFE6_PHYPA|nr:hypothetical protein PHYPA_028591 [Physcomitrium patens]
MKNPIALCFLVSFAIFVAVQRYTGVDPVYSLSNLAIDATRMYIRYRLDYSKLCRHYSIGAYYS